MENIKRQRLTPHFHQRQTWLWALLAGLLFAFIPKHSVEPPAASRSACDPGARPFPGYSFLLPDIINKNAAYAPFFVTWDDYYQRNYFGKNLQKDDNIEEWIGRFCDLPDTSDVEYVVYRSSINELIGLRNAALAKGAGDLLPFALTGNTFAEVLAINGCTEAIDYLMFAKRCEPHVVAYGDGWTLPVRDTTVMQALIEEGRHRFLQTKSHFFRQRYAYQVVRLAHYARQWQQTVDLYNYFIPKFDRKRPSILYYWTLGHLAGALQQLGKYPEAAYRYSVIFRHCPSKRIQAFRSFQIRNDREWAATLKMCQSDEERATLFLLRSARSHTYTVEDMETIYRLDPGNAQLELMLVSDIQQLEKLFLRSPFTEKKHGKIRSAIPKKAAAAHLLSLQRLVRQVAREKKTPNPQLWEAMTGYLELLAGDKYAADKSFSRTKRQLNRKKKYQALLYRQIEIWEIVLEIMKLDGASVSADQAAFRIRSYKTFQEVSSFEPFLQDFLGARYAESAHPGKAILTAYKPEAILYNPRLDVLDDLLALADTEDPVLLEKSMKMDTNQAQIKARLLETKGAYLFSVGQPEAALYVLRQIAPTEQLRLPKYSPFREIFDERINRPVTDTLLLNRRQILEKLLDYEFKAKAAVAMNKPVGAWYYYLIGLGYYNMSYFGYEWEAMDYFRSGANWERLAQGPVFPLRNSPNGNRENTDVSLALSYFEKALAEARTPELAARAAFMAARCQQKQWFCHPDCTYKPGSKNLPQLPELYRGYYQRLHQYSGTKFYQQIIQECRWLAAYQ
ncbi:MAG: hypothetical protein EP344_10380 [Bacteroidetes bacterium]|nr:MAG: hypothetical protein EP344_10380 [Bacteroidota bacterium]